MITSIDSQRLHKLLIDLIQGYTLNHDQLEVKIFTPSEGLIIFTIETEANDYGRILGKQQVSLKALQSLFSAIGQRVQTNIQIRLLKSVKPAADEPPRVPYDQSGDIDSDGTAKAKADATIARLTELMNALVGNSYRISYENVPSATVFVITVFEPISDETKAALAWITKLFGAKARRIYYIDIV